MNILILSLLLIVSVSAVIVFPGYIKCPEGQVESEGKCVNVTKPDHRVQKFSFASKSCNFDADCGTDNNMSCVDGRCIVNGLGAPCSLDKHCPVEFICTDGMCKKSSISGRPCTVPCDDLYEKCINGVCKPVEMYELI